MRTATCLLASTLTAAAMGPPPGTPSTDQSFAVRSGNQFIETSLAAYDGKILVIMLMTPWCPFCQSNASAVGDGILDPFNAAGRGALRGKNDRGIEIRSLLLSTEPASQWDATNSTFATSNGYQQWGLDANARRQSPRVMLGYYRGGYPNGVNSSNLYDWGEDRRRVTVLNLVRGSASHDYREIVLNRNSFTSSDAAGARALINAIEPPSATLTFFAWVAGIPFPSAMDDVDDDPDRDGSANLLEFFHGTDPMQADSQNHAVSFSRDGSRPQITYRRAKGRSGFSVRYRVSEDLAEWQPVDGPLNESTFDLGTLELVTAELPAGNHSARFYQLVVTLDPAP